MAALQAVRAVVAAHGQGRHAMGGQVHFQGRHFPVKNRLKPRRAFVAAEDLHFGSGFERVRVQPVKPGVMETQGADIRQVDGVVHRAVQDLVHDVLAGLPGVDLQIKVRQVRVFGLRPCVSPSSPA